MLCSTALTTILVITFEITSTNLSSFMKGLLHSVILTMFLEFLIGNLLKIKQENVWSASLSLSLDHVSLFLFPDKTHQRRTDYNENTIISTSASFNTSIYRALSLPERPHTSPPTLSGSIDFDLDNVSPRKIFKKYENLVDHGVDSDGDSTGGSNESSHSSSSVLTLTDDFSRKLKRSRSLNYLDEISTLGHRICFKNLQNIKEEMNTKNEQLVDNRTAGLSEGNISDTHTIDADFLGFCQLCSQLSSQFSTGGICRA